MRIDIKSSINGAAPTNKLDYVVFERYVQPNDNGEWKICGKLDMTAAAKAQTSA